MFALARTLVEMLTLELPRPADFADPRPSIAERNRDAADRGLAEVCWRATREQPAERFATMREMADAIGACETGL